MGTAKNCYSGQASRSKATGESNRVGGGDFERESGGGHREFREAAPPAPSPPAVPCSSSPRGLSRWLRRGLHAAGSTARARPPLASPPRAQRRFRRSVSPGTLNRRTCGETDDGGNSLQPPWGPPDQNARGEPTGRGPPEEGGAVPLRPSGGLQGTGRGAPALWSCTCFTASLLFPMSISSRKHFHKYLGTLTSPS